MTNYERELDLKKHNNYKFKPQADRLLEAYQKTGMKKKADFQKMISDIGNNILDKGNLDKYFKGTRSIPEWVLKAVSKIAHMDYGYFIGLDDFGCKDYEEYQRKQASEYFNNYMESIHDIRDFAKFTVLNDSLAMRELTARFDLSELTEDEAKQISLPFVNYPYLIENFNDKVRINIFDRGKNIVKSFKPSELIVILEEMQQYCDSFVGKLITEESETEELPAWVSEFNILEDDEL